MIALLRDCLHKILEVGLMQKLKTLSMVVVVLWKCRECCDKVEEAVASYERHHLHTLTPDQRPKTLTPEILLKVAMQPGFEQSITHSESEFTSVRRTCPRVHA